MTVFIEDTDAYSVIYNANYIRMYERALHLSGCSLLNHTNWYIQSITRHKFKSSPSLGEKFKIHGERCSNATTWNLKMLESSSTHDNDSVEKVYNTAQVTLAVPSSAITTHPSSRFIPDSISSINSFSIHRDELVVLDMTGDTLSREIHYMLPLRSILNLFERSRSNFLGGPQILRQMQTENHILWVVTSIDDLVLHYPENSHPTFLYPGQTVMVKTVAVAKRKGMIVEFHQTAEIVDDLHRNSRSGIKIATGTVTICAVDTVNGKPTSNIPPHIKQLFDEV